jgi:outer membrane protein
MTRTGLLLAVILCAVARPPLLQAQATSPSAGQQAPSTTTLTLRQAEDLALRNHPRVLAAQNEASAANQIVRETRSAYFPFLTGAVTGLSSSDPNARIGAGAVSASRLIGRFGQGVLASQLVTDLGRTPSLVASSKLQAQASAQNVDATREQVLLAVNAAFFGVLRAQSVVRVAQQTVDARQLVYDQVNTLAQNNLRSQLDVSFADVNLSDAKLLLIGAQNDIQEAYAQLARALGSDAPVTYQIVDEPLPPSPPPNSEDLVAQALAARPDVARLRSERDAAYKFASAERDLNRPNVTMAAVAGVIPVLAESGTTPIPESYAAAAVNVIVPVFNGGLFSARSAAALLRAMEADQNLREFQETVARDVRVAWANATTAFQRLDVTAQFLRSASLALDLAQGRYNLGLASIVELTQSQLNLTRAEIENLSAKYDYQTQFASLQYALGQLK